MKNEFRILYENPNYGIPGSGFSYQYEFYRDMEQEVYIDHVWNATVSPPHFHAAQEILYVERGRMHVTLNGTEYTLTAGQYIAVSGFTIHGCRLEPESVRWVMLIPGGALGGAAALMEKRTFARPVADDDGSMFALMKMGKTITEGTGAFTGQKYEPLWEQSVSALVTTALTLAIAACGLREDNSAMPLVFAVLRYIHQHFREEIRIPDIAKMLYCSQKTISEAFGDAMGMTIKSYIGRLRAIDVRQNLMQNPDMTLEQASDAAGFGSVRTMLRAYRQTFGCTPSENRGE